MVSLFFRPRAVGELAAARSPVAAVIVNAVNGAAIMTAASMSMLPMFTPSLVALLGILFGPLAGFAVTSLYARIEWTVGRRLGGKTSLDNLYRILAWSFLPLGFAALLYSIILLPLDEHGSATSIAVSVPSLVIACCAVRNYCSNLLAAQAFTRTRSAVSVVLTIVLFLTVIAGAGGFLSLLFRYGAGENLKAVFISQ